MARFVAEGWRFFFSFSLLLDRTLPFRRFAPTDQSINQWILWWHSLLFEKTASSDALNPNQCISKFKENTLKNTEVTGSEQPECSRAERRTDAGPAGGRRCLSIKLSPCLSKGKNSGVSSLSKGCLRQMMNISRGRGSSNRRSEGIAAQIDVTGLTVI